MNVQKVARFSALRYRNDQTQKIEDVLAEEIPVLIEYNGFAYTVRLATPSDFPDLALGLSLTEGILQRPSDLFHCEIKQEQKGFRLALKVSDECLDKVKEKKCQSINKENPFSRIDSICFSGKQIKSNGDDVSFTSEELHAGFIQMEKKQVLKDQTGATHAAAWMDEKGKVTWIREDVGRHNALDKLIGVLARENINVESGALLVTSRASYEMVHKCTVVGAKILAAVSAPTALAVRLADKVNLTLVGFVRGGGYTVYSGFYRLRNTD